MGNKVIVTSSRGNDAKADIEIIMKAIGIFTSVIAVIILSSILNGYTLSVLWGWFIIPVFNLPVLSIPFAIGLALTVSFLTHQNIPDDESAPPSEVFAKGVGVALVRPLVAMLIGYIVTLFI